MKKVYFVTGLAVLAVSAAMFTGCGSKTSAGAPATKAPAAAASAAQSKPAKSTASNTASNTAAKISVDDAKKAALTNAGVQESDVVYKKANLETEDGVLVFEIEFYAGDMEYNYDIDAASGYCGEGCAYGQGFRYDSRRCCRRYNGGAGSGDRAEPCGCSA